jgi:peptide/nickel transport system permease protein
MGEYYAGAGVKGDEVFDKVKDSLPRSLLLVVYVQLLTLLIAVPLGVLSAYRAGSVFDKSANGIVFALVALPTFVLAAVLKYWLGVRYDLLPTIGYASPGEGLVEHFKSMAMPVLVIMVGQVAIYARLLRSDMVATLQEDFILMAKAKGIPNRRILWRHALRPSSLTLLTVAGLNIGALVGGALIVERIFATGGIGSLIFDAVNRRQYVPLQSFIAVIAVLYVVINFFVDILYRVLDPRIRNA